MAKTPLELKQSLHRLEIDEIYWRGLQQYSANRAVQGMAARNLAEIKRSKVALQAALKEPKNLAPNSTRTPTHDNPTVYDLDRSTQETINVYLQAHEGHDYRP
jgi:hypothetical protein